MPVRVTDYISTTASSDTYATHKSVLGHGGHHEVETINERNAITVERKNIGMKVFVAADATTYELDSNLNWIIFGNKSGYTHTQHSAQTVWEIDHYMGTYPSVVVVDSVGEQVMGDIIFNTINRITITFSSAISGTAVLT